MKTRFKTTVWAGSNPDKITGSGYGINIPMKIRNKLFQKQWESVDIDLDGTVFNIPITDAFWRHCNEVRSKNIGKWLVKNNAHVWIKGNPTKLLIEHIRENKFKAFIKKN